ncbi:MAG: PKD domain-containing protein, partial [Bacteroidetes bacterium]|nr:PKD domain-containing protein [Bacteroidota bacterium]
MIQRRIVARVALTVFRLLALIRLRPALLALPGACLLAALVTASIPIQQTSAAAPPPPAAVSITASGFQPPLVTIQVGQSVSWTNDSGSAQSVTADSGLFDSGNMPLGAGFSIALAIPGDHHYKSTTNPSLTGVVRVAPLGLEGPGSDLANNHIPNLAFAPVDSNDLSPYPPFALTASRTRLLLRFTSTATVAQANAALTAAGVVIIGGQPKTGILLVAAPDSADFTALEAARASLRANPAVSSAAMDLEETLAALPRPAEAMLALGGPIGGDPFQWTWESTTTTAGAPTGAGGNWGLEASRFPQAWNLLETIVRKNNSVETGIIDGGFEQSHPDLQGRLTVDPLCTDYLISSDRCTGNNLNDHGTHVAGIIGATYDNPAADPTEAGHSLGVSGGNPVARMVGAPKNFGGEKVTTDSIIAIFGLMLDAKENGKIPNLRVINFSSAQDWKSAQVDAWKARYNKATCGPNDNDDGSGTEWCTPNNLDKWLEQFADVGDDYRAVAERAADLDVMLVQSAGNTSQEFCVPYFKPDGTPIPTFLPDGTPNPDCRFEPTKATSTAVFAWAEHHWTSSLPKPVLVVESIDEYLARSGFSGIGGDASAPGSNIVSTITGGSYGWLSGTSMAAPHVTALAGYLLAFNPNMTLQQLRDTILEWARADVPAEVSSRIDAFATLLSQPGAAKALVDVNDHTKDGNQRVIYGPGGAEIREDLNYTSTGLNDPVTGREYATDPDGKVDMRDFRRFRDSWLQRCVESTTPEASCPAKDSILLDGSAGNLKRDENLDGCVHSADPVNCPTHENIYSRFDFNGDGRVSRTDSMQVPLKTDGSPAASKTEATDMTDLQVLASQWESRNDTDPAVIKVKTEGWKAADLDSLMRSGDLEIHADDFFTAGATSVDVTFSSPGLSIPSRTLLKGDDFLVATVPDGFPVEVTAQATIDGLARQAAPQTVTLKAGEDKRLDLSAAALTLSAVRTSMPADGTSTTTITATLSAGSGSTATGMSGQAVTFAMAPTGSTSAILKPTTATTDTNGQAMTTFTAGTTAESYTVTAQAALNGLTLNAMLQIETTKRLVISYTWKETPVAWSESGSTRWTNPPPNMPDCKDPAVFATVGYCIDSSTAGLDTAQTNAGLTRQGTLTGSGSSFTLSETVGTGANHSKENWSISLNPSGSPTQVGAQTAYWQVDPTWASHYQNYAVLGVSAQDLSGGITINGLESVAALPYQHVLQTTSSQGTAPVELPEASGYMLLIDRGDGSALQYAGSEGLPITFKAKAGGGFEPYQYCGTVTRNDLTSTYGYRVGTASDWITNGVDLTRKTTYSSGDRPMPVGTSSLTIGYAFAAVVSYEGQPATTPVLPDCKVAQPPVAGFDFSPASPGEGRVVSFTDRSTDPDNDIVKWEWDFGDGPSPRPQPCSATDPNSCHIYADNGSYTVTLKVTDSAGNTNSTSKTVTVVNLPPEAGIDSVTVQQGQTFTLYYRIWDPGWTDQTALTYQVTSTNAAFPTFGATAAAGDYQADMNSLGTMPPGVYPLTLTVSDKDGATGTATATLTILGAGTPTQTSTATSTPITTCNTSVTLDAEEQSLVNLINAYRVQNGLQPLQGVSPTLTMAAQRHSLDMAKTGNFSHTGSDGSTPLQRIQQAGYPSGYIGENLALDYTTGAEVINGWKSSTDGHNENMLNPDWKAIGIDREMGSQWYWTADFGDVLDCPGPGTPTPTAIVTPAPSPSPFGPLLLVPVTPTPTITGTPQATQSPTTTAAPMASATPTMTGTGTVPITTTPTGTGTVTITATPTGTSASSPTGTAIATFTPSPTATATWAPTSTGTATPTQTSTGTATPTQTSTSSPTASATSSPMPSATSSPTALPTAAATAAATATVAPTLIATRTAPPTVTSTPTKTASSPAGLLDPFRILSNAVGSLLALLAPAPPSASAQTLLSYPPIPALALSKAAPGAGEVVTFTNLSRDASGTPIAAVLDFGDGSTTVDLAAGASTTHAYASSASYSVSLSATDSASQPLALTRTVVVGAAPTATTAPTATLTPTATATSTPSAAPDFTLQVQPSTQMLPPGGS